MSVAAAPRPRLATWLPPIALVVAYAGLLFEYLRPPMAQDAMNYFGYAADFPDVASNHWSLRVGLLLPVRVLQAPFGYSEVAYYVVPIVSGAVLILGTYWLGQRLFNTVVGLGAALVLLLSGPFLTFGTVLLPDQVAASLFVAALCLLLVAADRPLPWSRSTHAMVVGAGVLLGWAYLVREFTPLLYPIVTVVFASRSVPWRKVAWVAAPVVAILLGESILNWIIHGSPFERLNVARAHGTNRGELNPINRYDALVQVPRTLWELPGGRVLGVLAMLAPLMFVLRRQRSFALIGAWCLLYWVPLTLATGVVSPTFRVFPGNMMRFWMPILPAVAIGGLGLAYTAAVRAAKHVQALAPRSSRAAAGVVLGLAAIAAALAVRDLRDVPYFRGNGAMQLYELRAWLDDEGAAVRTIGTDRYSARLVPIYSRTTFGDRLWRGEVRVLELDADGDAPPGWVEVFARDDGALSIYCRAEDEACERANEAE